MRVRTYSPWPASGPAILAGAIVVAAYVIAPITAHVLAKRTLARVLIALDDIHEQLPTTD